MIEPVAFTLRETCARYKGLKPDTIRKWVKAGTFPAPRRAAKRGLWLFAATELEDWFNSQPKLNVARPSLVRGEI